LSHWAPDVEAKLEKLLVGLTSDPEKHLRQRSFIEWGVTETKIEKDLAALRGRLNRIEYARTRVWHLDEYGLIAPGEVAKRLEQLGVSKSAIQARIVSRLEQRKLREAAYEHEAQTAALWSNAWTRYSNGDIDEKNAVTRAVASSFGGLRIGLTGELLTGAGRENTPHKRLLKDNPNRWKPGANRMGKFVPAGDDDRP
jgi:hypothetical protein